MKRVKPTPHPYSANERALSRRAVANLEDARAECHAILRRLPVKVAKPGYEFPLGPSGGNFELSDGSEIHVEATEWADLREQTTGLDRDGFTLDTDTLAAWNAEHGVSQEKEGLRADVPAQRAQIERGIADRHTRGGSNG